MFRIDAGQRLAFSDQRCHQCIQNCQILTLYLRLTSRLCITASGNGICLLRNVVKSIHLTSSSVCTHTLHTYGDFLSCLQVPIRKVLQMLC